MKPWLQDADVSLYHGDCLEVLKELPSGSVDCIATSPPYWSLRDYQVEGQIGREESPREYVERMVSVFKECRRVLAAHGTCWVNLGDAYADKPHPSLWVKPKDLMGMPWRVAFALQEDGWWLRSDVIWDKPNALPESVADRPTKGHEYVFLLTKSKAYYFDQEAVREPAEWSRWGDQTVPKYGGSDSGSGWMKPKAKEEIQAQGGGSRNIRTVWRIPTKPYDGAHFAVFPPDLVRKMILAGCPEKVCRTCGAPSERIVERGDLAGEATDVRGVSANGLARTNGRTWRERHDRGWTDCGHDDWRPGVVLDPFMGSGTTALVARDHGRHSVGIELNEESLGLCADRLKQLSLLT